MGKHSLETIKKLVKEEDVEFIRLQFTDKMGTLKNIAVTASQLDRIFEEPFTIPGNGEKEMIPCGSRELYLKPDLDTFMILPWRPQQGKVARMICDVTKTDGTPCAASPRNILARTVEKAKKEGYELKIGYGCEFFLFHTDENGMPTVFTHEQAGFMDMSPVDLGENTRRDIILCLEEMGFNVESSYHAMAPGQHRIDFGQSEAMDAADHMVTFRSAVKAIAKRFGLHATFMPKPNDNAEGSGLHMSVSLMKNGKNLFAGKEEGSLSKEAAWFAGGVLNHAASMALVTSPFVNSYKRLSWMKEKGRSIFYMPAFQSPQKARLELFSPDAAADPYVSAALCLEAGLEGIRRRMEPEDLSGNFDILPDNLYEAIEAFRHDFFVQGILGEDFCREYCKAKKKEWQEYASHVTEWEISRYLYRI